MRLPKVLVDRLEQKVFPDDEMDKPEGERTVFYVKALDNLDMIDMMNINAEDVSSMVSAAKIDDETTKAVVNFMLSRKMYYDILDTGIQRWERLNTVDEDGNVAEIPFARDKDGHINRHIIGALPDKFLSKLANTILSSSSLTEGEVKN